MKIFRFKQKSFGSNAAMIGALGGTLAGSLLGNELHAQYDSFKAKNDKNFKKDADKEDEMADEYESTAKSLRLDKDYMKRYKAAKKSRDKIYKKFDKGEAEEWELDRADEEFDSKVPEGDVESIEDSARSSRSKANSIRNSLEKYRKNAGENAKTSRRLNPGGTGTKVGALLGALGGAYLGSKL